MFKISTISPSIVMMLGIGVRSDPNAGARRLRRCKTDISGQYSESYDPGGEL